MAQDSNFNQNYEQEVQEEESSFDIRELWDIFLRYKYWFIVSVIGCLGVAFVYLRYTIPMYNISTKVLIKDKENRRPSVSSAIGAQFSELGLMNNSNGFDNELEIISTKTMNKRVIRDLKLYTHYYTLGRVKDREIYAKRSPYLVDLEESKLDSLLYPIFIEMEQQDNIFTLSVKTSYPENEDYNAEVLDFEMEKSVSSFPVAFNTPWGKVTVEKNPIAVNADLEKDMRFIISPLDNSAQASVAGMSFEATSKMTTVAEIVKKDNLPERSIDYLEKLVELYNEDANEDNNIEATRTRDFIEERLAEITQDLSTTEQELEQYKKNSGIVNYTQDIVLDANQNAQYEHQLVEVGAQIRLVDYLNSYVNEEKNHLQVVPANIGLIDNNLMSVITKYNDAVLERNRLLRSASESSPTVTVITNEVEGYLAALKASLRSAKQQLTMQRNEIQNQQNKYTSRISTAPTKERALADIGRQQEVKAELYLMLLQKREENLITLYSSAYKAKLIEEPTVSQMVSPKRNLILFMALLFGLALPYLYHYVRNFFRYRIEDEQDLASICNVPLFGTVPFVKALSTGNRTIVLKENRNSKMMEVYRVLRSNLPFVINQDQNVILFTSSTSGEGKTCVASNLGASMAFAGKKVLIIGLDIRKPRLAGLFNISDTEKGISNFLSRKSDDYEYLESTIFKTDISPNLDILPAGTIPPNPAELLERENLGNAIAYLKTKYDYLILDTAPIGLVSDTLAVAKFADVSMYVVRANYTLKADISFLNAMKAENKMPNLNVLLNAVKDDIAGSRYGGYGAKKYGYGSRSYGYGSRGYGYGSRGYGYGYGDKNLEEV